jgi:signal transduction histidine kinase
MESPLKQSAVSDIASESESFRHARLRLTLLYVSIVGVIVLGFSAILYMDVKADFADAHAHAGASHMFLHGSLNQFFTQIVLVDVGILIASAFLSYVIAGFTLRNIARALEAQRRFAEHASHELRTPLAIMQNQLEVFLRAKTQTRDMFENIAPSLLDEVERMARMTEDLLLLARMSHGHRALTDAVDVSEILHHVVYRMSALAQEKGIALNVSETPQAWVKGHGLELERLFVNLVDNAIKHTPSGGKVLIHAEHAGALVVVTVTDSGSGIPPELLPHIFERFVKGDEQHGAGLGLSLVHEIVKFHRGDIRVESTPGMGSRFIVSFPLLSIQ